MVQRVLLQKAAGIGAADRQAGLDPVVRPENVGFIDPKIQKCVDGDRSRTVQQGVETDGFYPLRFERPERLMVRCAVATMLLARMVRTLLGHSVCSCA